MRRRFFVVFALAWACYDDGIAPEDTPPPPPAVPLETAIVQRYQEQFGESVPRPAVFVPTLASGSSCDWHVTTTTYLKDSGRQSRLLTMYTSSDGNLVRLRAADTYLTPAGTFRVVVALVHHAQSVGDDWASLWTSAQSGINADLRAFAASKGYASPIVTFENTNVLIHPAEIEDPRSRASTIAALAALGHSIAGYDVVVSINIDPRKSEGGFALPGSGFIYMGNFGFSQLPLTASNYASLARAVYGHEFAHLWGWPGTHDWATCHSTGGSNPYGFNFLVPPLLLGWEDVDGDRIPEILDPTPYGRP